jgi:hypothetical protein
MVESPLRIFNAKDGLVVAPPVLVARGVIIDRNIRPRQERLDALLNDDETVVTDIRSIFVELLGWDAPGGSSALARDGGLCWADKTG